jgi:hypothetical protein
MSHIISYGFSLKLLFLIKKPHINMEKIDLEQVFIKNLFFLLKKGLRDTIVMVRSPFTGSVSSLVGLVGTVTYYFGLINSEVLIGGERELQVRSGSICVYGTLLKI